MPDKPRNNKKTLLLVFLAFLIPVVLAKFALEQDWFNRGATNKGELLQPTLDFSGPLNDLPPKWRLVYLVPETCDSACENAIYSIQQVWLALGRETDRAQALVLATAASDAATISDLKNTDKVSVQMVSENSVNKLFKAEQRNGIFVVDTQNNAMLRYPARADKKEAVMDSRDMLSDVKKLLKLSRIG
ncbi:hypothetical protein [Alteromonas halophila]|uniref:Uncharacterized protein n=1 Tax=Alteromonas halophila TaxID=516698 RepID=A0A918JN74_9ALTE|nr:hypothetical protein [Alteromonas halophila]GGW91148.1 hypothetical protein GCM10007391_26830 [Alteromonas halophila]